MFMVYSQKHLVAPAVETDIHMHVYNRIRFTNALNTIVRHALSSITDKKTFVCMFYTIKKSIFFVIWKYHVAYVDQAIVCVKGVC